MNQITMTKLKENIDSYSQELFQPMTAKDVIYNSLKLLNRFSFSQLKNIEIESSLFQELYRYTISLDIYQKKIFSSRKLIIKNDELIILDINGEVKHVWLYHYDVSQFAKDAIQLRSAGYTLRQTISLFFQQYFHVNTTDIDWGCSFMKDLLEIVSNFELKHGPSRKIRFRNGILVVESLVGEYPVDFDIDSLKKEMCLYIQKHPNDVQIKNIIFGTLETVYQLKAVRYIKRDNLYDQLASFIRENDVFQENFERYQQCRAEERKTIKHGARIQKEKYFVENLTFFSRETAHSRFHPF